MKSFFFSFCLFVTFICHSQQKSISLQHIRTLDKVLNGSIDGKYDITIYLKVENFSDDHTHVFSVKGWYYYNNVKKNIPLAGVYSPQNGLTLFNITDKIQEKKILELDFPGGVIWEKLDAIEAFKGYNEKFAISMSEKENAWYANSKKLSLQIHNLENSFLISDLNLLKMDKTVINLSNYILYHKDFEIISKKTTPNETRLLLKYEELGNPNIQGMCGAAEDFGYIILAFNNKNELTYLNEIEIDNCRGFKSSEVIKTNNKNILKYKVSESNVDKDVSKIITIDTESVTLIK